MKEKNYKIKSIKFHVTDNGYRLDRAEDEEEYLFIELADRLEDYERYLLYKYRNALIDLNELKFKMQSGIQI